MFRVAHRTFPYVQVKPCFVFDESRSKTKGDDGGHESPTGGKIACGNNVLDVSLKRLMPTAKARRPKDG